MLLSKRPEMFLPDLWPSYFSKTEGCKIWDMDGNEFIDTLMMPGTNTLCYSHPEVDEAVKKIISEGNMSTLNAPEEVELTEKLINLHPWADMARFARSGGEANSVAIRIARAASGKDNVAFCGYHGWHDWYLASNLADSNGLDGHLLPGLIPKGVSRALKNTTIPLNVFDFNLLEETLKTGDVCAVKMEVMRNRRPTEEELLAIRKLCNKYNSLLIFDECTSGFREAFGGMHLNYSVSPDLMVLGKTMSNGYSHSE